MCALHTWDNLYRQNNDSEIQSFLSVNQSRESPDFPEVLKNARNTKEMRGKKYECNQWFSIHSRQSGVGCTAYGTDPCRRLTADGASGAFTGKKASAGTEVDD